MVQVAPLARCILTLVSLFLTFLNMGTMRELDSWIDVLCLESRSRRIDVGRPAGWLVRTHGYGYGLWLPLHTTQCQDLYPWVKLGTLLRRVKELELGVGRTHAFFFCLGFWKLGSSTADVDVDAEAEADSGPSWLDSDVIHQWYPSSRSRSVSSSSLKAPFSSSKQPTVLVVHLTLILWTSGSYFLGVFFFRLRHAWVR